MCFPNLQLFDSLEKALTDILTSNHLEKAAEFYLNNGTNDEYVPHLARVCFWVGHNMYLADGYNASADEALNKADEYLDKVSPKHRRRQVGLEAAMFDAEVVIWAR